MRSWVLMTAFITSTLVPLTLLLTTSALPIVAKPASTASTVIDESATQSTLEHAVVPLQEQALWHMPSEIIFQFSEVLTALTIKVSPAFLPKISISDTQ
ncbi:hypothetical protein MTCD1_02340 [Colwellia marinimaniae]|uniref:Uncharacterized protein n=2 Tax=Colwelliaceae TaxID=267889 RepID=A0ABQ0MWJ0_9GAMM|nr:hypothetical protein MTCD1_02340 [Colwellia marinimaniae]